MKSTLAVVFSCTLLVALLFVAVYAAGGEERPSGSWQLAQAGPAPGPGTDAASGAPVERYLADEAEIRQMCEETLSLFLRKDCRAAFLKMARHTPFSRDEMLNLAGQTEKQFEVIEARVGRMLGSEFVTRDAAGQSLLKFTYILKYEKHALRWRFVFYKPKDKWLLSSFHWDDKLVEMF